MTERNKKLLDGFDWASSALGARDAWPAEMKAVVSAIMNSGFPICTAWGPHYVQIYNTAYNDIYGEKHPACFGRPARESWPEIWPFLEPALAQIRVDRKTLWFPNTMLPLVKHVEAEECWFDFCYSPLENAAGDVIGVMSVATEKTAEVVAIRRNQSLPSIPSDATFDPLGAISASLQETLSDNEMDVCLGVLYRTDVSTGASDPMWHIRTGNGQDETLRRLLPQRVHQGIGLSRFDLPPHAGSPDTCAGHGVNIPILGRDLYPVGWLQLVSHRLVPIDSHMAFARMLGEHVQRTLGILESHASEVGEARALISRNEQIHRFLFDNIDDAAFYTVNRGDQQQEEVIAAVNHKASELLGYSLDELVGMDRESLFFPDDPALSQAIRTRHREGTFVGEMTCRRKDGSALLVEISSRLIELPNRQSRSVSLMRDISKRKQLERERLEQARYEAMSLLTNGVAHDFNNLLTVILNSVELIKLGAPANDEIAPYIDGIIKSAERGATLTGQLLAYSRRQMQQPQRAIQINDIVMESRDLLESLLRPHRLELVLSPDLPTCPFDPTQLTTILLNLAANAHDAMVQDGSFTLSTRYLEQERCVQLTATDTGRGMAADILGRIFDPYFTTKSIGQGSGLGLAMVKGLVTQSGGSVTVESQPGRGATFALRFPIGAANIAGDVRHQTTVHASIRGARILLVDDNQMILDLVSRLLRDVGATVTEMGSAREALQRVGEANDFDLILSDVVMPGGMSGIQLLRAIRDMAPGMARLLMSGYLPEEVGQLEGDLDDVALLQKPFSRDSLLEAVAKALALQRAP